MSGKRLFSRESSRSKMVKSSFKSKRGSSSNNQKPSLFKRWRKSTDSVKSDSTVEETGFKIVTMAVIVPKNKK